MDISTKVLFSTLSQIKNNFKTRKKKSQDILIKNNYNNSLIDKKSENFQLEYQIIKILLLYGNFEENFNETEFIRP